MEERSEGQSVAPRKTSWADRLRGRARMALACLGGILGVGLLCVTNPLVDRIATAKDRLKKAETRAALAESITNLRHQATLYQKKLPTTVDLNDWTHSLLTGLRSERAKLARMDPKDVLSVGPCKVLTWQIEMEGDYQSLCRALAWIENGPRLVRIDRMAMQSSNSKLSMLLIVHGLAMDKPQSKGVK